MAAGSCRQNRYPIGRGQACKQWLAGLSLLLVLSLPGRPTATVFGQDLSDPRQPVQAQQRVGKYMRISAPITDRLDRRVHRVVETVIEEAKKRGQWPVFIFEIQSGRTEFGRALDLARYLSGPALNGATTVAYLPEKLTGHGVLVAIACDEIIMHEDAELGDAGEFEAVIEPSVRSAYVEIANRRKTVPADLALGMLDPAVEVLVVETDVSREYVLADRLEALQQEKSIQSTKVLILAGKPGLFRGMDARELGMVSYLAADRSAVAKALGLPREAIEEDPSLEGDWRPVRIDVKGPITPQLADQIQKMVQTQIRDIDTNFFCLWIDSPGGSPTDSMNLAHFLAALDPGQRRTVAYIPSEARGDAAFIALACDQIVMHPSAMLGGSGAALIDVDLTVQSMRKIAEEKYRSPALVAAMVDPNRVVYQYTRQTDGLVDYFSQDDVAKLADADKWRKGAVVSSRGRPLRVDGDRAEELGLARSVVGNFAEFKALYDLQDDPKLVEPGWADFLIDALNSPGVSWFLLLLGGAALYAELHAPGIGLGGLIAAICFLLFFWLAYLDGTAGWLEVLLFATGLVCLALEVFVLPGFGVFGLGGGLLIICALVLASQTFVVPRNDYQLEQLRDSMLVLAGAGVGILVVAALTRRYLPHAPVLGKVLLAPPQGEELSELSRREALTMLEHLVGAEGKAVTPLVPGGKARFGDELVDVVTDGDFIDRGQRLQVVEVLGNHVVVRSLDT